MKNIYIKNRQQRHALTFSPLFSIPTLEKRMLDAPEEQCEMVICQCLNQALWLIVNT
jgi:hypothetical protein